MSELNLFISHQLGTYSVFDSSAPLKLPHYSEYQNAYFNGTKLLDSYSQLATPRAILILQTYEPHKSVLLVHVLHNTITSISHSTAYFMRRNKRGHIERCATKWMRMCVCPILIPSHGACTSKNYVCKYELYTVLYCMYCSAEYSITE